MHLPRPKLFRKRQARPDKPIRNFFRRFFCVFALCMTAPQPVTISQDEQIRQSSSNGRCRRQQAIEYEQKILSGSSNTDSLFTTSEISVGLPVVNDIKTQDHLKTMKLKSEQTSETTNPTIRSDNTKQLELEVNCETSNPSIIPIIETRELKIKQLCVSTSSTTCIPVIETCKMELDQICVPTTPTFIPSDTRKEIISEPTNPIFRIPFIETRILKLEDICEKGTTTLIAVISTRKFKLEQITDTSDSKLKQLTEVKTLIEQPQNILDTISEKLSPVVSPSSHLKLEECVRSSYALDNKESGYTSSKNIHERSLKTIHRVILEEEEEEEYTESTIINAESSIFNAESLIINDDHMNDRSHL